MFCKKYNWHPMVKKNSTNFVKYHLFASSNLNKGDIK